jgi:anti-sigma B factor antagonist
MFLELRVRTDGDWTIWQPCGELDMATVRELEPRLLESLRNGPAALEMQQVTFCDSSGLHCLRRANETARRCGVEFEIREPSPNVARVIELTGLAGVLPVRFAGASG